MLTCATSLLTAAHHMPQGVGDVMRLTKNLEEVSLRLQSLDTMQRSNMTAIHGKATSIDVANQVRQWGQYGRCKHPNQRPLCNTDFRP